MSWKKALSQNVRALRVCICPKSESSSGARKFISDNYGELKTLNPKFPILIREASGIEPYFFADLARGRIAERSLSNLKEDEIASQLKSIVEEGATLAPR